MFHQPSTNVKCTQQLTGLEKSLAAHTSVDNMDENNKFVCTECNKSNDKIMYACIIYIVMYVTTYTDYLCLSLCSLHS